MLALTVTTTDAPDREGALAFETADSVISAGESVVHSADSVLQTGILRILSEVSFRGLLSVV